MRLLTIGSFVLLTTVCLGQSTREVPYVLLVSFDGFRYDYVEKYHAPNFQKIIREGTSSTLLIPSFPSKTFPNHYTLITGLYPGNHGIGDNSFMDPASGKKYAMNKVSAVKDATFYGGTPLWQLAQQQGLKTASLFWVGSEAAITGVLPTYTLAYKESMPNEKRIDQVRAWLTLPPEQRPHIISMYFSLVDTEAHNYGPESSQVKDAVLKADELIGKLDSALATLRLPINLVVVSDHGMAPVQQTPNSYIALENIIDLMDPHVTVMSGGTQTHFYTTRVDSLYACLQRNADGYKVYRWVDLPQRWHYNNPRIGDILLVANPGKYIKIRKPQFASNNTEVIGEHGYDPAEVTAMSGIFYAKGPLIKSELVVEPFENIHVYPFIAKLLGLKIGSIDGDEKVLDGILKNAP